MANTVSQAPLSSPGQGDGFSTVVVGSDKALKSLAENLAGLATKPLSLYLDAVGLGTNQVIDLELLILPKKTIYIVKTNRLGTKALSVTSDSGTSLRSFLGSESVPKVAFDIRGLSRILFHRYNLSLDGMYDLQLMELASRDMKESKKYLAGLAKCIDRDIPSTNPTKQCWLQPNDSTNMHLFNSLGHVTRDTMRQVELFPSLWSVYRRKLGQPGQAF
ncbi:hypothetical protein EDB80DRAFT_770824 [Ilyonectria destructans]|nr:hypothetical protein EDB80DRAFT_770824 [Ilyonectria destructans]